MPDLDAAVAWFDENQVTFVKRADQGKMKDVAFIKNPDGYWIEIVEPARLKGFGTSVTMKHAREGRPQLVLCAKRKAKKLVLIQVSGGSQSFNPVNQLRVPLDAHAERPQPVIRGQGLP